MNPVVLAFDTAAPHCAAALLSGGRLTTRIEAMATGQAERLILLLELLLAGSGHTWRDLTGLGVGTGPGNFTGIRIGVSAARGLALALAIPAIGVTGFEAAARGLPRPLTIALPAPRGQIWRQHLTADGALAADLIDGTAPRPDPVATVIAIAHISASRLGTAQPRPAPFYVRGADAAPPRDPAPVLLP